ncbi:PepSY domain-containing protein [Roseovarius sp. CH_XMU1461]|uniref:PepSY domain-containing protein n=1 Tax=Roseovarius sp. CH_XMU1461 TaxID=3107777 RepID=UPI0030096723
MKRTTIAYAASSGLLGLSILAGSLAYAQNLEGGADAAELQAFLEANPDVVEAVTAVEIETGGTVVEAEFDDETPGNSVVEFEIEMADGSEQEVLYHLADGSMTVDVEDGDEGDDEEDNEDEAKAGRDK